ncbi:hypothetical protein KBC75_00400 [Candidatus Shapirobacteria bacterium]|nr:hypothetical protein [Candidatus Shapirobacteria bacterium]
MQLKIPISVISSFDSATNRVGPRKFFWRGVDYTVSQIGLHHTIRRGQTLFHIFSVTANQTFFRLSLNTDNLFWELQEVSND